MTHLEPTYLRYIYDGLIKGSIHPENAAELPEGLIGLYEEAFDERQPVYKRQQLLERFAIWALLKKEVSAAFVAEVLGESEDDIQEFISTYSSWFNSPESGKYQLYHERLKVYMLQRNTIVELYNLNERLISKISQLKQPEAVEYYVNYASFHYWLAQIDNPNDDRFKLLILKNDYLKIQFDHLSENSPIYNGFHLAIQFYSYKRDKIVPELIRKANLLVSEEFNRINVFLKKNANDIKISEYLKLKEISHRIGDNESFFQLIIFSLSELILEKSSNDELFNFLIYEIKEYLESDTIPLDFYIPLLNLIILVEFDQSRTDNLIFLFDFIYSFRLVNFIDVIDKNSIWVKFHHDNIYNEIEEKHITRFFWLKKNILPKGYDSIMFILEIWDKLCQFQKELIIKNITVLDISLLIKGNIYFAGKSNFIEILIYLNSVDKIDEREIKDIFVDILLNNTKPNFEICYATLYYLKSQFFNALSDVDKINFGELFFNRVLRIKKNFLFEMIMNEVCNYNGLISFFNSDKYNKDRFQNRINKISHFNPSLNCLGINKYYFNSNFIINDIKNSIDESFTDIENISTWVIGNVYYLALKNHFDKLYLNKKIAQIDKSNPHIFYSLQDFELIEAIVNFKTELNKNLSQEIIDKIKFPPHKEALATQIILFNEEKSLKLLESIRKLIPKRNETERNLMNRIVLSLGLALKDINILKQMRISDFQQSTEYSLAYSRSLSYEEILKKPNKECAKILQANHERFFDGQINEMILSEYFKMLNHKKTAQIIDTLFKQSRDITNEFDCYGLRSSLFLLDHKNSKYFNLKNWIIRIEEYDHVYWKGIAYSEIVEYLLNSDNLKSALDFYESYLFSDNDNNYPKIRAWQNIIRYYIKTSNFEHALTLFNELKDFPDPEFFPSEDEFKLQIFISKGNVSNFKKFKEFFNSEKNNLQFEQEINKLNLELILDFICGENDLIQFLENFKSIIENWYEFDFDEIFEMAICENSRYEILKDLKNSQLKLKNYYVNLLFKNIQKNDLRDYPIHDWMIELPSLIELNSIIEWHEFLNIKKI